MQQITSRTLFFLLQKANKSAIILRFTCFFWIISKLLSPKLWHANRIFPLLPIWEAFSDFSVSFHYSLFVISLVLLAILVVFPKNKNFVCLVLCTEIFICSLDQMRWQPWEYQNILFLLFYLIAKKERHFLQLVGFLLVCTYFYSGLSKWNSGFLYTIWEYLILSKTLGFSSTFIAKPLVHYSGLSIALFELFLGLGLLLGKNKRYFAYLGIFMHVIILLLLGPLGANINQVVWSWNFLMPILLFVVFYPKELDFFSLSSLKNSWNSFVFLLIGVLPITCFFGFWHRYLSFHLYTGNSTKMRICVSPTSETKELHSFFNSNLYPKNCALNEINVGSWAMEEIKVPMYAEQTTFFQLKKELEKKYPKTKFTFSLLDYPYQTLQEMEKEFYLKK